MLKEPAFANSLTILTGVSYIVLYLLAIVSRDAFRFLFNAQYFVADVASLLPQQLTVSGFVGTLVALLVFVWVFGCAWAWLSTDVRRQISTVPGTRCSWDGRQGATAHGFSAGMPTAQR
jgi:hypothetical protein